MSVKVYDKCPVCNIKLEPIKDINDEVIDFWCNNCGISFNLEDLEYEDIEVINGKYEVKKLWEYF